MVTIRNKETGEVKQVDENQLPGYGLSTPSTPTSSKKSVEEIRKGNKLPEMIGGVGGGILGTIAGGFPGGVIGATGGGAIGSALNDLAAQIFGLIRHEPVSPPSFLRNAGAGAEQGLYDAVGGLLAKGLGFAAHPIKSVVNNMVVKPLANSPALLDIGQVLGDLYKTGKEQFAKKLMATAFPDAYNNVTTNVAASVADMLPHIPAENLISGASMPMGDIASQLIPVADANVLKTAAQRGVGEMYGQTGAPVVELQKILASLLKQGIEGNPEVPASVGIGNKIASTMYGIPDTLTGLTYGLPWAAGRSVRAIAGIPIHLAQFLLSNPGTRYGLPALTQLLLNGANSGGQ